MHVIIILKYKSNTLPSLIHSLVTCLLGISEDTFQILENTHTYVSTASPPGGRWALAGVALNVHYCISHEVTEEWSS